MFSLQKNLLASIKPTCFILFIALYSSLLYAKTNELVIQEDNDLHVGKVCPVQRSDNQLGILIFSRPWFHNGGTNPAYQARDNATGVGLEIHFMANTDGHVNANNIAQCQRYRILQTRHSNAKMHYGEARMDIDVPTQFIQPFYDNDPLEFGRGTHKTPTDNQDKPWSTQQVRASSVAIYDTPYVSDHYGIEGNDIRVKFETCVVCERLIGFDLLLSCGAWGFERTYMDSMTGWSEPEFIPVQCQTEPSQPFLTTLDNSSRIDYQYWLNWR